MTDMIAVIGFLMLVAGVAWLSAPWSLIVGGAILMGVGLWAAKNGR